MGHAHDGSGEVAIAGIGKTVDLDRDRLARPHEADVLVEQRCFHFHAVATGHYYQQRLCRRHHAAHGVHGQLLHGPVHRCAQCHLSIALSGLGHFRPHLPDLLLGLAQFIKGLLPGVGDQHP